jgi:hypothetical protein
MADEEDQSNDATNPDEEMDSNEDTMDAPESSGTQGKHLNILLYSPCLDKPESSKSKKKKSKSRRSAKKGRTSKEAQVVEPTQSLEELCATLGIADVKINYTPEEFTEITNGKVGKTRIFHSEFCFLGLLIPFSHSVHGCQSKFECNQASALCYGEISRLH